MAESLNMVALVGNLTKDPELRTTPSGTSVGNLRIAVNSREKRQGEWTDHPNYFDVTVWGAQAENCVNYLAKGRQVAVQGRLRFEEWEAQDGSKRSAVKVVAQNVQFIGPRGDGQGASSDVPADTSDLGATPSGDDDIPF